MRRETVIAIVAALIAVMMIVTAFTSYRWGAAATAQHIETETDTIIVVDTIPYYHPVPKDSVVVRYETRILPAVHQQNQEQEISVSQDSAEVSIPITQKVYEADEYKAYVSGYEPSLDSIMVYPQTALINTIVRENRKPPRWHIGVTGGYCYGLDSRRFEPYIGVGITYSFLSF